MNQKNIHDNFTFGKIKEQLKTIFLKFPNCKHSSKLIPKKKEKKKKNK